MYKKTFVRYVGIFTSTAMVITMLVAIQAHKATGNTALLILIAAVIGEVAGHLLADKRAWLSGFGLAILAFSQGILVGLIRNDLAIPSIAIATYILGALTLIALAIPKFFGGWHTHFLSALYAAVIFVTMLVLQLADGTEPPALRAAIVFFAMQAFAAYAAWRWNKVLRPPWTLDRAIDSASAFALDLIGLIRRFLGWVSYQISRACAKQKQ